MKDKIIIESNNPNFVIINGKKYILERESTKKIDAVEHSDKLIYKELNEKEYEKDLNLVIKTLAEHLKKEELLREILKEIPYKVLRRLVKRINSKKPIKKHHGCLGVKIGDAYVQLLA